MPPTTARRLRAGSAKGHGRHSDHYANERKLVQFGRSPPVQLSGENRTCSHLLQSDTAVSRFRYVSILNSMRRVFPSLFATVAFLAGQNFKVDDVKVVGDLSYGQTSSP